MEGAAVAHVAHLHGVPVGEVRGISNLVANRDRDSWRLEQAALAAQEMDPDVTRRHIDLYVNAYTRALDERTVARMLAFGEAEGLFPRASGALPLFA